MDVKLRQHMGLYQRQQLVMTQRLQQALKLLQIPTLELEQVLRQELQANPLLEEVEPDEDEPMEETDAPEPAVPDTQETSATDEPVDWDEYFRDGFSDGTFEREHEDEDRPERLPVSIPTGQEELHQQLVLAVDDDLDRQIGEYIIGSLDESGFLTAPVEEIAAYFEVPVERVEKVLEIVQGFDPPGVAARDLRECLLLQLKALDKQDTPAWIVVRDHFESLKNRRFQDIAREMGITPAEVQQIAQEIGELDPRPGLSGGTGAAEYITPDLVVEKVDDDYVVYLNDGNLPRLRISQAYDDILQKKEGQRLEEAAQFIGEKRRYAEWLIKTIEQRRRTMIRVMEAIVREQRDFFEHGAIALKPLTLQQIASAIGMHESTVSRVTKNKYVQTPRGVFPLKYFFSAGLDTDGGEEVAAKAVKEMIQEIIAGEDPAHPLSDKKIVEILAQRGLKIARRTVAKYREQLGILNARMRRQFS